MTPLINSNTKKTLEKISASKPHATLLSGAEGIGLATIAKWLASEWGETVDIVKAEAKTKTATPSISVEKIRQLYATTKTKSTQESVAIIDDADKMTESAQNALLKLLEEPGESVHFILTAHEPDRLLPTVVSRVQRVHIQPIDAMTSSRYIKQLGVDDEYMKRQLLYVASGLPALINRLVSEPKQLETAAESVRMARDYINGDTYKKLVIVNSIGNDRQKAIEFMDMVVKMLKTALFTNSDERIVQRVDSLLDARDSLQANGNVRLQLAATVV